MSMVDEGIGEAAAFVTLSDGDGLGTVSKPGKWLVYGFVETIEEIVENDEEPTDLENAKVWIELDVIDAEWVQKFAYGKDWNALDPTAASYEERVARKTLIDEFLSDPSLSATVYYEFTAYLDYNQQERLQFFEGGWFLLELEIPSKPQDFDIGQAFGEFPYDPTGRSIFLAEDAYTDQAIEVLDATYPEPDPACLGFLYEVISLNHIADDIPPDSEDGGSVPPLPVPSGTPPIVTFPHRDLFFNAYDILKPPTFYTDNETSVLWDCIIRNSQDSPAWVIQIGDTVLKTSEDDSHTTWSDIDGNQYTLFTFPEATVIFKNDDITMTSPPSPDRSDATINLQPLVTVGGE